MSAPAIRIANLGKEFPFDRVKNSYPTFRAAVGDGVNRVLRRKRRPRDPRRFWALRDVSFDVQEGEVVGIIGNNGAGKSTLLKILSRITAPTTGSIEARGRVGALLEVGTGFHAELTGRENVYLNGAILGMKKAEIDRKFDEIVAFSELEQFLDTPVKHYSSGMQVRLAFAVAAHLEPEILIIDEVLAVGDAAFQKKCLGKMQTVSRQGRTVLFVSHNLGAVRSLCSRGIILQHGVVTADAPVAKAVATYLATLEAASSYDVLERTDRQGKGDARITRIDVSSADDAPGTLTTGRPARFVIHVSAVVAGMSCSIDVFDPLGQQITYFNSALSGVAGDSDGPTFVCDVEELLLVPNRYRIDVALTGNGELQDKLEGALFVDVEHGAIRGWPVPDYTNYGSVLLPHRWTKPV